MRTWGYAACVGGFALAGGIVGGVAGKAAANRVNNQFFLYDRALPVAFGTSPYGAVSTNCVNIVSRSYPLIPGPCGAP
jgi:hypothetical protein